MQESQIMLLRVSMMDKAWHNQLIKINTDLSIDKSVQIVRTDLIDINYCTHQLVEINITLIVFFIDCC